MSASFVSEFQRVGETLGRLLRPGDLVLLQGSIGAGKTTFTQGVARGMGLTARVTSPSFTLLQSDLSAGRSDRLPGLLLIRVGIAAHPRSVGRTDRG